METLSALGEHLSARAQWSCPQQGSLLIQKPAKHFSASELTHIWGGKKSLRAAAYKLTETPVAKSLIFQPYSLNISLLGAKLSYSVLNSWGMEARQQNNSQLWLRGLGINKETPPQKNKLNGWGSPWHILIWASLISSLSLQCSACMWRNNPKKSPNLTASTLTDPLTPCTSHKCYTPNEQEIPSHFTTSFQMSSILLTANDRYRNRNAENCTQTHMET